MHVSVHTLGGTIFDQDNVPMVTLPGALGDIGVLDHQSPFMARLTKGTISLQDQKGETHLIDIDEGYVHVRDNKCLVMASFGKDWREVK